MSVVGRIPAPIRKAAVSVLPTAWVQSARKAAMRRFDLPSVVVRESRAKRWVARHVLGLYYPPSMVSRESSMRRWLASRVLRRRPRLNHFEIHLTDHCNLNCKGCGHFSNLCGPALLGLDAFETDMSAMAALFDVEQIFLLGGEPLLHPQVSDFVRAARRLFPDTRLYLMTNGTLVTRMNEAFWHALADTHTILLCDLYPIGLPVEEIDALGRANGVVVEWTDARSEFFKIPIDRQGGQDPADSFRRCSGINNCPMVKDGRIHPCAYVAYVDALSERFGLDGLEVGECDSISIRDGADADEIMRFLTKPVPWCRHCDFDSFEMFEWGRSQRGPDEWLKG